MLFYAALLPQFLKPTDPVFLTSLALTAIHWCEGMAWLGFLIAGVSRIRERLLHPRTLRWMETATGVLLCGFALRMALARLL
jgi:threonine/homoserine/homoserine lactone efflux protein